MHRILVTGATGLVGSGVAKRLAEEGCSVTAMGRRERPPWTRRLAVQYVQGDIRDKSLLSEVVPDADTIVHLAAKTGASGTWESFYETTVTATEALFEILLDEGGKRVVLISSMGNYAGESMHRNATVDEDFPLEPNPKKRPHYAHAKTLQDRFAQQYLEDDRIDLTIVRPGVVLSTDLENLLLGAAFPADDLAWVLLDDGERDYQFIHLEDVAEGINRLLATERSIGEIYNLVHPGTTTRNDAVAAYKAVFGDNRYPIKLHLSHFLWGFRAMDVVDKYLPGPPRHLAYQLSRFVTKVHWDGSKIGDHTGWTPEHSITDSYRKIANGQAA